MLIHNSIEKKRDVLHYNIFNTKIKTPVIQNLLLKRDAIDQKAKRGNENLKLKNTGEINTKKKNTT